MYHIVFTLIFENNDLNYVIVKLSNPTVGPFYNLLSTLAVKNYLIPRFIVSEVPIIDIARSILLQIFTAPPVPTPPQWVI